MSDITLGIIGSGQLGSLLCQAAKKLKVKTIYQNDVTNVVKAIMLKKNKAIFLNRFLPL